MLQNLFRGLFGRTAPASPPAAAPVPAAVPTPMPAPAAPEPIPEIIVTGTRLPPMDFVCPGGLTVRSHMEVITHEAIVPEAYRDSKKIWTWGVGVTNASGHIVHPRYLRNPQTLERCLEVYEWLVRQKYLPEVRRAFGNYQLNEHQLAAALSFHWNTGGIARAQWVKSFLAGDIELAKTQFMNWRSPAEIVRRREAERDLFFDGKWTNRGTRARVITRVHANGNPVWSSSEQRDIADVLGGVLARAGK